MIVRGIPMAGGFGKAKPKPKTSERTKRRQEASQEMDNRRTSGDPEIEDHISNNEKKQKKRKKAIPKTLNLQKSPKILNLFYLKLQ